MVCCHSAITLRSPCYYLFPTLLPLCYHPMVTAVLRPYSYTENFFSSRLNIYVNTAVRIR